MVKGKTGHKTKTNKEEKRKIIEIIGTTNNTAQKLSRGDKCSKDLLFLDLIEIIGKAYSSLRVVTPLYAKKTFHKERKTNVGVTAYLFFWFQQAL